MCFPVPRPEGDLKAKRGSSAATGCLLLEAPVDPAVLAGAAAGGLGGGGKRWIIDAVHAHCDRPGGAVDA